MLCQTLPVLRCADTYTKKDVLSIQESIVNHVEYTLARSRYRFDDLEAYLATAHSLRDRLIEVWNDTQTHFREQNPKRVYYLSMEFLMGRSLLNALYNLEVKEPYTEALLELGYNLETLIEQVRCHAPSCPLSPQPAQCAVQPRGEGAVHRGAAGARVQPANADRAGALSCSLLPSLSLSLPLSLSLRSLTCSQHTCAGAFLQQVV